MSVSDPAAPTRFLEKNRLQELLDALMARGFTVIGPTLDQEAIVYGEIRTVGDLPQGWTDRQGAGQYRLERRSDDAYFGFVVGPHSWKRYLFPPRAIVAESEQTEAGWEMRVPEDKSPQYAFLGVRACELAAIRVQDKVFLEGNYVDPIYKMRRQSALIIAVNCTQAGANCFCTSMQTGPECRSDFDIALTEIAAGFEVVVGSERGREILSNLPLRAIGPTERDSAGAARAEAVRQMRKQLDTAEIRDLLFQNLNHPQWANVAERCLSCTNCTMVCPTCFCSSVQEVPDLSGTHVSRERQWDSCFNLDFSLMNGGFVRNDIRSRYRQWLTHKLASWIDQFGTSGCVGCGRCITWCPVGIDLTEEVAAIRESAS